MKKNIFTVLIGFDMESDLGTWSYAYEGLRHATPKILKIMKRHKAVGTFYFVGQAAKDVPRSVLQCHQSGHEIGTHSLFHETVGELLYPIPGVTPLLPGEIFNRLRLNTDWVQEITGVRPKSFRAPRLCTSTAVSNALEKLNYVSDASSCMSIYPEQLLPYHPSKSDWKKQGKMKLVQIPNFANLATGKTRWHGVVRYRDQWPLIRTKGAKYLLKEMDTMIDWIRNKTNSSPVMSFFLHPWEFHPMPQGRIQYPEGSVKPKAILTKNCGDYALEQFDLLLKGINERGGAFKTAEHIATDFNRS